MSLFDALVDEALKNQRALAPLRAVVEKELLHHDILRVLSQAGLLAPLTFIGGTCLRACYGSSRLSEDLDFTSGAHFTRESLRAAGQTLVKSLQAKYGLPISVSEPVREAGNVDTWKLKIQTRPEHKNMPAQRVNIDVCAIPSYQPKPMVLLNPYGVEMGTSGLIIQAQSREEIFADKLVAFALRPNRIKHRDMWDIAWLHQQTIKPAFELLTNKLRDHHCDTAHYLNALKIRCQSLNTDPAVAKDFSKEMQRFLPAELVTQTVENPAFWQFIVGLVADLQRQVERALTASADDNLFKM